MADVPAPGRILVMRVDRIGDVVLSTPVLEALRKAFPHAFIAVMVRDASRDVVEGNPHVNEVILYEKEGRHRSFGGMLALARRLRTYDFDTVVVLHPSDRAHLIARLARIPVRVGYARKSGWLLTHRVPHHKHEGKRHEAEYALEVLQVFGITPAAVTMGVTPGTPVPFVPVHPDAAARVSARLAQEGIAPETALVVVHPSASCPSKRWMPERFADVADRLVRDHGVRVCLVAGQADAGFAAQTAAAMREPALNLAGQLTVAELAALLARARLLISNDSGPVHVAAGVGTPVVAIFGRNQPGVSQQRWRPLGAGHVVLQKDVGCVNCLAHLCDIGFLCLTSLSAEDVYLAAAGVLARPQPVN